ncbi:hypothetical protein BKA70DRAFT_1521286 [Coprinopsis sp. MPI-PUGE-AT-0042]|nr:hypothetical protein BKA70DRAFT_1521286 [Coprinopsis sp. MPI-PUGE-AT-0042]
MTYVHIDMEGYCHLEPSPHAEMGSIAGLCSIVWQVSVLYLWLQTWCPKGNTSRKQVRKEKLEAGARVYQEWRITNFSTSVAVNAITTPMICICLILMERKMKRLSERTGAMFRSALPYRQLLTLLLESALPFTLVGVVGAICTGVIDDTDPTYRHAVHVLPILMVLWINALALGPQLIVFRIISGMTWTSRNPTTHRTQPISQPILFADDPVVSVLTAYTDEDHELENQEVAEPTEAHED